MKNKVKQKLKSYCVKSNKEIDFRPPLRKKKKLASLRSLSSCNVYKIYAGY